MDWTVDGDGGRIRDLGVTSGKRKAAAGGRLGCVGGSGGSGGSGGRWSRVCCWRASQAAGMPTVVKWAAVDETGLLAEAGGQRGNAKEEEKRERTGGGGGLAVRFRKRDGGRGVWKSYRSYGKKKRRRKPGEEWEEGAVAWTERMGRGPAGGEGALLLLI